MNIPPPPKAPIEMDGLGSPINNKDQVGDELDFEKEILDTANQSMFGGGGMREHSRIIDPSNLQDNDGNGSRPPPPAPPKKPAAPQLSFEEQIAMASQNLKKRNEQQEEERAPPKAPPKAAPLSFAEQIAMASAGLKKKDPTQQEETKGPAKAPPKAPGKDAGPEPPQKRMSNMDALKQQILLRKQSMNPTLVGKNDEEPGAGGNLARMAMAQSKFGNDSFDDVSEKSSEDSD